MSHGLICHASGVARELALTARIIDGVEAERLHLVTRCYPTATAMAEAVAKTTQQMASKSPLAVTGTKRIMLHCRFGSMIVMQEGDQIHLVRGKACVSTTDTSLGLTIWNVGAAISRYIYNQKNIIMAAAEARVPCQVLYCFDVLML